MEFPKAIKRLKLLSQSLGNGTRTKLFIEDVAGQKSLIQQLKDESYPAEGFKTQGQDKVERLQLTTLSILSGKILFPEKGAENLIGQLIGFGKEKHDDLVDAFTILILKILGKETTQIQGYFYLFYEEKLKRASVEDSPHVGEKRLGIVIAGGGRKYSAIVLRSDSLTELIYKDPSENPLLLATKILELAEKHKVMVDKNHIIVDNVGLGKELREQLERLSGKKYFGINPGDPLEDYENGYANILSKAFWTAFNWLEKGGKLKGKNSFNDLVWVQYKIQSDNKVKIISNDELLKEMMVCRDVADAFMLTFTRKIPPKSNWDKYRPHPILHPYQGRGL